MNLCSANSTLTLAVWSGNVNVRQSTSVPAPASVRLPGSVHVEQQCGHLVEVPLQLLQLGRRPAVRLGPDQPSQSFQLVHPRKYARCGGRKKGARIGRPRSAGVLSLWLRVEHHPVMELIRFLVEAVLAWIRDAAVALGGRFAEDFIGERIRRRWRKTKGQRKARRKMGEKTAAPRTASQAKHSP